MKFSACRGCAVVRLSLVLMLGFGGWSAGAQMAPSVRIADKVDAARRVTLSGNTHPLAVRANDRGAVEDGSPMRRMVLTLAPSQDQEMALGALIGRQQDKGSTQFHKWLTPVEYGAQFGIAPVDLQTIMDWLTSEGFSVGEVVAGRNAIEFSGTAGQVKTAFRTEIHRFEVDGRMYQANASDPSIPAALATVVRGVMQMHNFPHGSNAVRAGSYRRERASGAVSKVSGPVTALQLKAAGGGLKADFTYSTGSGGSETFHAIGPYDLATIYNVAPLWAAGIDGTGQTIAIVQESNIHLDDVRAFRALFGLPPNDPEVILNGPDPGIVGDESEADIDVQWAGAVAKGATIKLVVTASTEASYGVALSALYIVNNNVAPVVSYSYGECELATGTALNSFYNTLYEQAAAQGMSVMVSTGDAGSAVCNRSTIATSGTAVNGWGSTPYNTAVGGTDFIGSAISPASYWSSTNNSTTQASALGYIPETTWNDMCTNPVFWQALYGYASDAEFCQYLYAKGYSSDYLFAVGGSGGVSSCTVSSGGSNCSGGWPKPSYQSGLGVPADGKRDVPDVSLMASNGFLGSFYIVCQEDANSDGSSCNLNAPYADFEGYGGTSVATPVFAGMMALVNQKTNERQGVANYVLYDLFRKQVSAGTACGTGYHASARAMVTPASGCVFNDLTYGSNAVPCSAGSPNCTVVGGDHYGILTVHGVEAYDAAAGYDLASGLGSVNSANMVDAWANVTLVPTATSLALSSTSIAHGSGVDAFVRVSSGSGVPTGNVELLTSTAPASLGYAALSGGSFVGSYSDLPGGSYSVSAYYGGDGTYAASSSAPVAVIVMPENSRVMGAVYLENESTGVTATTYSAAYGEMLYVGMTAAGLSGKGVPTGTVTIGNGGAVLATVALNSTGEGDFDTSTLAPGIYSLTGSYSGDTSFNPGSTSVAWPLTITRALTTTRLTVGTRNPAAGAAETLTGTVAAMGSGVAPTGSVSFYSGAGLLGTVPFGTSAGVARLTTTGLPYLTTGSSVDSITAVYSGDANYAASISAATSETVGQATKSATYSTLNAVSSSFGFGASTGIISVLTYSGTTLPTGTISFYVDGALRGSAVTVSGARAGSVLDGLSGGQHVVEAIYSGDGNFLGSTGVLAVTVTPASVGLSLTGSMASALQGSVVTFTATVAYAGSSAAMGTIAFSVDGVAAGAGMPVAAFSTGGRGAYFNVGTLLPGRHTIAAAYTGDRNYAAAGASASVSIAAAPFLALSVHQAGVIVLGAPVSIGVVARTVNGGPIPTGGFVYAVDGGTASTAFALMDGAGSFTLAGLSELRHMVVVTYSGDAYYAPVSESMVLNGDVAQTILFRGLADRMCWLAPTLSLSARATSGLPVTYAVTGPAVLQGSVVTILGPGRIAVTASQAGDGSFAAAAPVTRSFVAR